MKRKRRPASGPFPALTRRDFSRVLDFINNLYETRSIDDLRSYVLRGLETLVPGAGHAWGMVGPVPGASAGESQNLPELATPAANEVAARYVSQHPVYMHYLRTGESRFVSTTDVEPLSTYHRSDSYNVLYRPLGVRDGCGLIFPTAERALFIVGVMCDRAATDHEKEVLNATSAHLIRAYWNTENLERLTSRNALLEEALSRLNCGGVVLNHALHPRYMFSAADRLLSRYFGKSSGAQLPDALYRWVNAQISALCDAADLPGTLKPLVIKRNACKLTIRLFPKHGEDLLLLEEQTVAIVPGALAALGLTRRQTEVLSFVAMGKTNPEIAVILGLSPRTVEKTVENILQRLAVENRTAAAALAVEASRS